jgi:hypothetical protein
MSIAEQTRDAVRDHPFLYEALRAGVVNYTDTAAFLDVGDEEAVAAALRRYETELAEEDDEQRRGSVQVRMERGLGKTAAETGPIVVGDTGFVPEAGDLTGIIATGPVSAGDLRRVLGRCETADIDVEAAGVTAEMLVVVVGRREGANALRLVEDVTG